MRHVRRFQPSLFNSFDGGIYLILVAADLFRCMIYRYGFIVFIDNPYRFRAVDIFSPRRHRGDLPLHRRGRGVDGNGQRTVHLPRRRPELVALGGRGLGLEPQYGGQFQAVHRTSPGPPRRFGHASLGLPAENGRLSGA